MTETMSDYERLEITEIHSRSASLLSTRIKTFSFFGTADLAVLSLAFMEKASILVLLAALIIGFAMIIDWRICRLYGVYMRRGKDLEKLFAPQPNEALMHLFSSFYRNWISMNWFVGAVFFVQLAWVYICWRTLGWEWL